MRSSLAGLRVLVTRPKPQGEELCDCIETAGGRAFFLPTITIQPIHDAAYMEREWAQIQQQNWLIFLSRFAVEYFFAYAKKLPAHLKIAAVGSGTSIALRLAGCTVHAQPQHWSSEGLLALAELQEIAGTKIMLVRGEGGRTYLAEQLAARGAAVRHFVVYRRVLPSRSAGDQKILSNNKINAIICTSNESLINLVTLLGAENRELLFSLPLVVVSERIKSQALLVGFSNITVAENASHDKIIKALKSL